MASKKDKELVEFPPLATIDAPAGFETIDDSFGEDWDYETKPMIIGPVVGAIRSFVADRGKPSEHVWRACNIADEEDGVVYTIKESASLRAWFDKLEEGVRVYISFRGYQDVKKASPMKVYQAGIDSANPRRSVGSGVSPRGRR